MRLIKKRKANCFKEILIDVNCMFARSFLRACSQFETNLLLVTLLTQNERGNRAKISFAHKCYHFRDIKLRKERGLVN